MYQYSDASAIIGDESVDSVRLIKTNKEFYIKFVTLFLKFKEVHSDRF